MSIKDPVHPVNEWNQELVLYGNSRESSIVVDRGVKRFYRNPHHGGDVFGTKIESRE